MKIHLDLDSFFISAQRLKAPNLIGVPAAVGGRGDPFIFDIKKQKKIDTSHENSGAFVPSIFYDADETFQDYFVEGEKIRGIIITSSYEARAYGVKTGMSIKEALSFCPQLKIVPPDHLYYHRLSADLRSFLERELPKVEQYSIDEFFADLSGWVEKKDVERFLRSLQSKILQKFGLPISIGAAKSKWTAKLATSYAKPYGIKVVEEIEPFIKDIPIQKFPGIGRGYLKRLRNYGVRYLGETKKVRSIFYSWKKPGIILYKRIWGIDGEEIEGPHTRKSIGISRTIDPISDRKEIKRRLIILSRYLSTSIARLGLDPRYFALSLRYESGIKSRAHLTIHRPLSEQLLNSLTLKLFRTCDLHPYPIIRLSLRAARFHEIKIYDLLHIDQDRKLHKLLLCNKKIRDKYGADIVKFGCEAIEKSFDDSSVS